MMTRKDFQAMAEAIKFSHPRMSYPHDSGDYEEIWMVGAIASWEETKKAMTDFCEKQNPRFDRDKFVRACTPAGL